MFAFLSTFLVLSHIRGVGDGPDRDSSGMLDSNIIIRNIRRHPSNVESAFYEDSLQLSRRLLEHPHWIKQAYRGSDYNVVRKRHQARNKPDDGRSYRSALKDDEDEDEDEDEENEDENDEEDKINDETIDEAADEAEQANADEEDEETVNEEPSEVYDYG